MSKKFLTSMSLKVFLDSPFYSVFMRSNPIPIPLLFSMDSRVLIFDAGDGKYIFSFRAPDYREPVHGK